MYDYYYSTCRKFLSIFNNYIFRPTNQNSSFKIVDDEMEYVEEKIIKTEKIDEYSDENICNEECADDDIEDDFDDECTADDDFDEDVFDDGMSELSYNKTK